MVFLANKTCKFSQNILPQTANIFTRTNPSNTWHLTKTKKKNWKIVMSLSWHFGISAMFISYGLHTLIQNICSNTAMHFSIMFLLQIFTCQHFHKFNHVISTIIWEILFFDCVSQAASEKTNWNLWNFVIINTLDESENAEIAANMGLADWEN